MPTTNPDGMPLYSDTEAMPAWNVSYNAQSTALSAALAAAKADDHAADSCLTIASLPTTGNWPGRVIMVEENDMLYVHDGTGWWIYGGKLPFFFGSRPAPGSAVGAGSARQGYITTTGTTRGITRVGFDLVFQTPGIYKIDEAVVWGANPSGQRNLGIQGTGITVLGAEESYALPGTVEVSQSHATYISVSAPGSTATPYVTHNSGAALSVYGSVSVMWVSA